MKDFEDVRTINNKKQLNSQYKTNNTFFVWAFINSLTSTKPQKKGNFYKNDFKSGMNKGKEFPFKKIYYQVLIYMIEILDKITL